MPTVGIQLGAQSKVGFKFLYLAVRVQGFRVLDSGCRVTGFLQKPKPYVELLVQQTCKSNPKPRMAGLWSFWFTCLMLHVGTLWSLRP